MKKWQIAVVAVTVVAVAVAALFGGRAWGQSASSNDTAQARTAGQGPGTGNMPPMPGDGSQQPGAPGAGGIGGMGGGNIITGSIIAADDTSVTVKTSDGGTKIILTSASTSITKTTAGSLSDLVVGENVLISGTTNADNTVTASSIVLGSNLGLGGVAGGGAPPAGDASAPVAGSAPPTTAQ